MSTTIHLFDTMSREKRPLTASDGERYRFYCCGPTVYGPAHIGNFRTFVVQDVFRRVLEQAGLNPVHVRNITNVDDKTIRESQAEGKSLSDFTRHWTERFHADSEALGLVPPHHELGAVETIGDQIALIERLIESGHAYQAEDGSVYFRIAAFPEYGRLSRLQEREITTDSPVARMDDDEYEDEHSAADFALWKARKTADGPNHWDSPWGPGRPGWHLECSAMAMGCLGDSIDLHSGGVDLVFPHHENEIAQSEAATGKPFVHHWFHIAHLMVNAGKMSKSAGTLYTLNDLAEKGFSPMDVRYTLLAGHYRRPLNFTLDGMEASQHALGKLQRFAEQLQTAVGATELSFEPDGQGLAGPFAGAWEALCDDLNVPRALGEIFSTQHEMQATLQDGSLTGEALQQAWTGFRALMYALGFDLQPPEVAELDIPDEIRALAERRWQAKQDKDWAAADTLRNELTGKGWIIKDSREGYEIEPA